MQFNQLRHRNRATSTFVLILAGCVTALPTNSFCMAQVCEPAWMPTFTEAPGTDHRIYAMETIDLGSGPALYVGGEFTTAGNVIARGITKWDGQHWSALGDGVDHPGHAEWHRPRVNAIAHFHDGSGPAVYVGGRFTMAGGVPANSIARWDGTSWSALGSGVVSGSSIGEVRALAVFDDGSGSGPALYAAGPFSTAGGIPANRVARWDGESWSAVGSLSAPGVFYSLEVFDDGTGPALYGAGIATNSISPLWKWDGTAWSPVGDMGFSSVVNSVVVFDDGSGGGPALYIGGYFGVSGGAPGNGVAKWDGESWSSLGSGLGAVHAMHVFDDGSGDGAALYVGIATSGVDPVHRWDGASWSPVGAFHEATVLAFGVFDDGSGSGSALYAGGWIHATICWCDEWCCEFGDCCSDQEAVCGNCFGGDGHEFGSCAGRCGSWSEVTRLNHIAKFEGGSRWSALGSAGNSIGGYVLDVALFDDGGGAGPQLYVTGGTGITPLWWDAGGERVSNIARWDGSSWSPLGDGLNWFGISLQVFDVGGGPALYVGGDFSQAGGVFGTSGIARWDGASWSPLGSGLNGPVYAMEIFDDGSGFGPELYVGGAFTTADGWTAHGVAKWNGWWWSPVGPGLIGTSLSGVLALKVFDDGNGPALYAAGMFSSAGDCWCDEACCSFGDCCFDKVDVCGGCSGAVVGTSSCTGRCGSTGGTALNRIAKWDGASWSPLGPGLGSQVMPNIAVNALEVFDNGNGPALYAGGNFQSRVARWNGTSWSPLGGVHLNDGVTALATFDDGSGSGPALYAGGWFTAAGATTLQHIARWNGSSWSPVAGGVYGATAQKPYRTFVRALRVLDNGTGKQPALYATGGFSIAGSSPAYNIAIYGGCDGGAPGIPGDLNGDGSVGVPDLLILLANWGPCADCTPGNCPADLTGDCTVGVADLLALLSNWG